MARRFEIGCWSVAASAVLLGVIPAHANWPATGTPIIVAACEETPTAAVADASGGMFVFWTDNRTCGRNDVYVQRLKVSGAVATGWPGLGMPVCTVTGGQGSAAAVSDGVGGAIVIWEDSRSGQAHLYAQRIGPTGARLWSPAGVPLCDATGDQVWFDMISDGGGGVFVGWMDTRRGLDDRTPHHHPLYDLYAQHLDRLGARTWATTGNPVATNALVQAAPSLVTDGGSGVLITWFDSRGPAYLQHLDGSGSAHLLQDGVAVAGRFLGINDDGLGLVAADGAGGMISAFMYGPDTQHDLYAQRVDSTGTLVWPLDGVLVASAPFDQRPNAILPDGNGGAFIASHDLRNGKDWDVYVQRITSAGAAAPGWPQNGLVVCTAPGFQIYPKLIPNFEGGCLLAWYDARDSASAYDIYAQQLTAQGVVTSGWPASGVALCKASGDQSRPLPVSDGAGGALVAWSDYRVYADVYAQRVSALGVVGDTSAIVAVEPPGTTGFALGPVFPNPLVGQMLLVPVSLPSTSPAELSLLDVQGRLLAQQAVPSGSAGSLVVQLKTPTRLSPGVYLIRLAQAGRMSSRAVSIVN